MRIRSDLTDAFSRFEGAYRAAIGRRGAPVRLIRRVRHELLLTVGMMPEVEAMALVQEATRYISRLAGHWNGGRTAA
jgi:hypothetical protein